MIAGTAAPVTGSPAVSPQHAQNVFGANAQVISRARLLTQRLSTTVRIPLGLPTLIGGMTFPGRDDHRALYLFVEATAQALNTLNEPEEANRAREVPAQGEPDQPPTQ